MGRCFRCADNKATSQAHRMSQSHDFIQLTLYPETRPRSMSDSVLLHSAGWRPFPYTPSTVPDCLRKPVQGTFPNGPPQAAFPDHDHPPPCFAKSRNRTPVALHIPRQFCFPEPCIAGRCRGILAALMTMPETSVNENYDAVSGKDEIRRTGQPPVVQPIAQPLTVEKAPNQHLRTGILAANSGHHSRADSSADDIDHDYPLFQLRQKPDKAPVPSR